MLHFVRRRRRYTVHRRSQWVYCRCPRCRNVLPRPNNRRIVRQPGQKRRVIPRLVKKFEQVLQLPRALPLQKPLRVPRRLGIPLQHGLLAPRQMPIQLRVELLPGLDDGRLVQQPVNHQRVIPVAFVAAVLVVARDVIKVAIPAPQKGAAEAAGPGVLALRVLNDAVGVGASLAPVGVLVMLVERVGAPEDAVAVGAGIPLVPLVELVLVTLPVELTLEGHVAKGAPKRTLGLGCPSVVSANSANGVFCCRWRRYCC